MSRLLSHLRVWMFPMFLMGISMIVFGVAHRSTEAQSTALKISSISVNAWTSKTATIAYTVSGVRSVEPY